MAHFTRCSLPNRLDLHKHYPKQVGHHIIQVLNVAAKKKNRGTVQAIQPTAGASIETYAQAEEAQ
jgi:hypothetical protein